MSLLALSASWIAGVALALQWDVSLLALTMLLPVSGALVGLLWARGRNPMIPLAVAFLLLGMAREELRGPPDAGLHPWLGAKDLRIEGLVREDPEVLGTVVRFRFQVRGIGEGQGAQAVVGDILVSARPSEDLVGQRDVPYIRYGDRLELQGTLEEAPVLQEFDYREYLARQGIQGVMSRPKVALVAEGEGSPFLALVYRLRGSLARSLEAALPEPQSSLAQTLLLGIRGGLPTEVTKAFRDTGTSHLLAISGLNVAVVLWLALAVSAGLLGRKRNLYLLLPLGLVWLYALLSAFSPSVERAVIMATLYLVALAMGRQRGALTALGFAAALMVAVEPGILYDLSFQLSFASMAGILFLWPPLESVMAGGLGQLLDLRSWWAALAGWLLSGVAVGVAALVATWPLLAFNFHSIAWLGVPATLLALPALGIVLATSLVASVGGLVAPALGQLAGWVAWLPLSYMLAVVEILARLPRTVLHLEEVAAVLVWAYYGGAAAVLLALELGRRRLLAWWLPWHKVAQQPPSLPRPAWPVPQLSLLLSLATGVVLLWTANSSLPDGKLHVAFLEVGHGDAIFIQTPEGQQMLVDGGPDPRRLLKALGKQMPFWDRTLDMVVVSHAHEDHLAGLPQVLRRYLVAVVVDNPYPYNSTTAAQWRALVAREGARVVEAREGQTIKLGNGVTLEVLNPPEPLLGGTSSDVDNNSTVVRLRHGGVSFLLTGDLHWEGEASLLDRGVAPDATVLKVAHHGSATSSSQEFLGAVRPRLAVVSVDKEDRFGHPNQDVMARLAMATSGAGNVLTTAQHGDIILVCDGQRVTVKARP